MPDVAKHWGGGLPESREAWILIGFAFAAPMSFPHNIDYLKYTSAVSVVFMCYIAILAFIYALPGEDTGVDPCKDQNLDDDGPCNGGTFSYEDFNILNALRGISIFVLGFGGQVTVMPICNELVDPSQYRLDGVWLASGMTSLCLYTIVGTCGYLTYGSSVQPDFLRNYPNTQMVTLGRICVSLVVAFSYPLQANPSRRSFMSVMEQMYDKDRADGSWGAPTRVKFFRYYGYTLLFLGLTLMGALLVEDLGVVMELMGATGGVLIMFILPGGLYIYHFPYEICLKGSNSLRESNANTNSADSSGDGFFTNFCASQSVKEEGGNSTDLPLVSTDVKSHDYYDTNYERKPLGTIFLRNVAWVHFILGLVLMPLLLILIFV